MKTLISLFAFAAFFSISDAKANHCSAEMMTQNGHVIQSFYGNGYYACEDARRSCQYELDRRQSRGQNRYAFCRVNNYGGGGGYGRPQVTRHCTYEMRGQYGRLMRTFTASATGPARSGVRRQACNRAYRRCLDNRYGYYGATCFEQGTYNGGYNPRPRPRPRPGYGHGPRRGGRRGHVVHRY